MSLKATQLVWTMRDLTTPERLVLLCIADFANDEGLAWPSATTIGKMVEMDERSVRRIIKRLGEDGRIEIVSRAGRPSTLRLTPDREPRGSESPRTDIPRVPESGVPRTEAPPTPDLLGVVPRTEAPPEPLEPSENRKTKTPPTPQGGSARGFDQNPCPKVGKVEQAAALAAINAWSEADRRTPLLPHRAEVRKFWECLDEIATFQPVPTANGLIPAPALVPLAIDAKRANGVRFKSIAFAMGCVRSQLQEWESGAPEGNTDERDQRVSANSRGTAACNGHQARRKAQASREYAESPDKPSVPVWSPDDG